MIADLKEYADGIYGDYRRAAAITTHFARGDHDGVFEILNEASQKKRCAELVLAILRLHQMVIPHIADDDGVALAAIQQLAAQWAMREGEEPNRKGKNR